MKYLFSSLLLLTFALASCSTQRVLVEAHTPNAVRLTSQSAGCRLHRSEMVGYWLWGAGGTKSTAHLVRGARGPVRIEFKNTPGSVLLTALLCPVGGCFFRFKTLQVYECAE